MERVGFLWIDTRQYDYVVILCFTFFFFFSYFGYDMVSIRFRCMNEHVRGTCTLCVYIGTNFEQSTWNVLLVVLEQLCLGSISYISQMLHFADWRSRFWQHIFWIPSDNIIELEISSFFHQRSSFPVIVRYP